MRWPWTKPRWVLSEQEYIELRVKEEKLRSILAHTKGWGTTVMIEFFKEAQVLAADIAVLKARNEYLASQQSAK